MDFGLFCDGYHNRKRARESYNFMTREMENDMTGELVFTLPIDRFYFGTRSSLARSANLSIVCVCGRCV